VSLDLLGEDMYREHILDHYKNPRNFGKLKDPDVEHHGDNPLCGDEITMQLKISEDGTVTDVKFEGVGCAISQASASMLTEWVKGKRLDEIMKLERDDMLEMLGVQLSPIRVKCAVLGLMVLKDSISIYRDRKKKE